MMAGETISVIGATGLIGRPVTRQLVRDGYRVRVLVRDPSEARRLLGVDADYLKGDVEDEISVERAVRGCRGVMIVLAARRRQDLDRIEHRGTAAVAKAAAAAGVGRLGYVSGSLVNEEYGEKIPEHRAKLGAEAAICASGVPFVLFRPSYFMDNLPRHIQGGAAVVLGRPQPLHMVAASDFAHMVSRAFQVSEAANGELYIQGPEAWSIGDALRLYCSLVQPGKRVVKVPLGVMRVVDGLFMGGRLRGSLELMGLLQRVGERGDPSEANRLLGAPTTTLREWCLRQAPAMSSPGKEPST